MVFFQGSFFLNEPLKEPMKGSMKGEKQESIGGLERFP